MAESRLNLSNIGYFVNTPINSDPEDSFSNICGAVSSFNYEFELGRSYLLNSRMSSWGQSVSYIVSGWLKPHEGKILRDGALYPTNARKRDACRVRRNLGRKFLFWEQTVEDQVLAGLKKDRNQFWKDPEIIRTKMGVDSRYKRPLRQLSFQAWRASCAIGLARGQDIFCFPYMPQQYLEMYHESLAPLIQTLTEANTLVLFPAFLNDVSKDLCNVVVEHDDSVV